MKILIVDFDEDSTLALSEYLKSEGFSVSTAGDGEAGLEKCKAEYPDLVIVEPMISKLHGFELCSIISHDFNGQIPVVILTKFYREEQFKIEAMSAYGASAFLSKPFKGPEILSTIKDLLKEKIEESEEDDMAEDTQNLEEFSDKALDNIKVEAKATEEKLQEENDENGILELVSQAKAAPREEEKTPDISTQIDKMLADTLSEFGLNLGKKGTQGTLEKNIPTPQEKVDIPAQEQAGVSGEIVIEEVSVEEKESEEDDAEVEEDKVEAVLASKAEEDVREPEKEIVGTARDKEGMVFSVGGEDEKTRISPIAAIKNSLGFLKKLRLKFIIPLVLVAAIALSASFIFRRPKSTAASPQKMTAAMQPVEKTTNAEPEEILIDNPDETEQSTDTSSAQEPPSQTPTEDLTEDMAQVKTKVNEVFPVKEAPDTATDVETVDLDKDVLSVSTESVPEPIFDQGLTGSPGGGDLDSTRPPSEVSVDQLTPVENPNTISEDSQPEEPSQDEENPPVEEGDLVPLEDVDIVPEIASRVDPKYPSVAFQRGVEGKVVINVLISETGDVIETAMIKGIQGPYGFNEECSDAVRQWKFVPAFKNGVKVKVWKTISFTFKKS